MEFFELLESRSSCRRFSDAAVDEADLERIIAAGRAAPVGSNRTEDLHFTLVRDRAVLDGFLPAMRRRMEDRAAMADITEKVASARKVARTPSFDPFYGAPAVVFVSHRAQDVQPGIEFANAAIAAYTMHLAATDLGLGSVLIWGATEAQWLYPDVSEAHLPDLPEGFATLMGLAIGYRA